MRTRCDRDQVRYKLEKMINVTHEAYTRLVQKASEQENPSFRLGLTGGGCGGMEYTFDYCRQTYSTDLVLDWGKLRFYIDHNSAPYMEGLTLDYEVFGLNEQFVFRNPNESYRCGCGVSVGF